MVGTMAKIDNSVKKKVPELRFKGFTDDWEERKLKDILREFSTKSKIENEYRVLSSTNVGMEFRDGRVSGTSNLGYKIIKNGDLVLSPQNLWLGNININNIGTGLVSPSYKTFNFTDIDSSFIKPQLRTPKMLEEYKNSSTQGASVVRRNLEIDSFYQIKIATPSIKEQEKIGSFFKQLDNTIALHQRKLDLLKEQKKGFLQKMFPKNGAKVPELRFAGFTDDWEERKLGEITTSFSGGTPSSGNSSYYKGDIPFIRSGEINSDKTELFLTEAGLKNSSAKMVSVGDILYALYGATSGEVGISQINGAINQAILAIKPCDGYNSHFLMQWLKLQKQKIIDKYLQGGQGNLSGSIVKNLVLNVPSYEEQQKIGVFFKQLDDTIALHQRKLDLLKEQKKGFLQKMFV